MQKVFDYLNDTNNLFSDNIMFRPPKINPLYNIPPQNFFNDLEVNQMSNSSHEPLFQKSIRKSEDSQLFGVRSNQIKKQSQVDKKKHNKVDKTMNQSVLFRNKNNRQSSVLNDSVQKE